MDIKRIEGDDLTTGTSRRDFLKASGQTVAGISLTVLLLNLSGKEQAVAVTPAIGGYLLVDRRKCQGCLTCMLACCLANEGIQNLSLSRIQILQNPLSPFPADIAIAPCLQCKEALCVDACPSGALAVDTTHNRVISVDAAKCIGCMACLAACPFEPARVTWHARDHRAGICDLCLKAPYFNPSGGPGDRQACVAACPVGAIKLSRQGQVSNATPRFEINLRGDGWKKLGYSTQ